MFMLVVGGALGWYFTYQGQRIEQRISSALRQAGGLSEADMAVAVESALRELSIWLRASRAVLALWATSADYYAICQYPPQRGPSDPPPVSFDQRPEWACMAGNRMDFHANDVSLTDESGRRVQRDFDLHPYLVQKFEIYNAVGCGLFDGEKPIGRLLLINCVGDVRPSQRKKMHDVAHLFREVVRHLLVVRRTEYDSAENERGRIAHDLHDGPLQSVISFEMRLQIIRKLRERDVDAANSELDALYELSRRLVGEMRTFVHRMRPIESDDSSLSAAARRLVEGFQKETGVAVTVMGLQNGDLALPGKVGSEVLKIAREALHNIYKHAQATHVLFAVEKKNSELRLSVDDNGQGFRFGGKYTLEELDALSMGPRSIKQRVRTLGGRLTLESNPGHGANLRVTVPLTAQ
jgi:signal transduction histidine kinase